MNILFVCTGNVFRSMTAEKCFRHYCLLNNIDTIVADSAGIAPFELPILESVKERLAHYGINEHHTYKATSAELITNSDIVIAMGQNHKDFIENEYGLNVPLYNQIAYHQNNGIPDIEEALPEIVEQDNFRALPQAYSYTQGVVDYIYEATPHFVRNLLDGNT